MSAQAQEEPHVPWIIGQEYYFIAENADRSPDHDGVYALVRGDKVIYIGSGNIRERLQRHFKGDNPCITREAPTAYYRETCPDYRERERELREAYPPLC